MEAERVAPEAVTAALRSVRAAIYRVEPAGDGCALRLLMNASTAGRRNAAGRIVRLLAEHGLELDADDPVEELTRRADAFRVRRVRAG